MTSDLVLAVSGLTGLAVVALAAVTFKAVYFAGETRVLGLAILTVSFAISRPTFTFCSAKPIELRSAMKLLSGPITA